MKLSLTIAALFVSLSVVAPVVSGQQMTCSCEKTPDRTCHGTVTCANGCTALCGSKDTCYLSCRSELIYVRITVKFAKEKGEEIASVLSNRTHMRIQFVPYPRNARKRYDLEIKDDDIWNSLRFLDKRGNVKIGGADFGSLRRLRKEMRTGKKVSVKFIGIPARDAVDRLSFMSGFPFRVKSGDPEKLVSISLKEVTLGEIIDRISTTAGIEVEKRKAASNR